MSWHAVDAVDDAVEATRRFLFPFSLVRWAKLALLVLLMGGGVSTNASVPIVPDAEFTTFPGTEPGTTPETGSGAIPPDGVSAVDGGLLAAVVAGIVLVAVVFSIISLSLRFVFYDALRTNEVRLWQPFLDRLRQAFGLFVFSAILSVVTALPIAVVVLVSIVGNNPIGWQPVDSVAATLGSLSTGATVVLGALGVGLFLIGIVALRFTYEFVVPTMIVEETGVLAGWSRLSTTLRSNVTDVVVYLVVHFVISIGLSIVEGIAVAIVGGAVAVIAGLVLLIAAVPLGGLGALVGTTVGIVVLVTVVLVAVVTLLTLLLPVRIVTRSYQIAYEVSTLGGIDPGLALLHPNIDPTASAPETPPEDR